MFFDQSIAQSWLLLPGIQSGGSAMSCTLPCVSQSPQSAFRTAPLPAGSPSSTPSPSVIRSTRSQARRGVTTFKKVKLSRRLSLTGSAAPGSGPGGVSALAPGGVRLFPRSCSPHLWGAGLALPTFLPGSCSHPPSGQGWRRRACRQRPPLRASLYPHPHPALGFQLRLPSV